MVPAVEVDSINIVEAMAEKFRAALLRQDVAIWNFYDLAEIFFDVDGTHVTQAKWHYHDCRTHLFVDAFSRQIGQWCGRHGLQFTGHCLVEDTLSAQVMATGSCMRFYEHQQTPAMDELTERWRIYDTAKQVASVANQFGRRWRLTETYGCTGWDFALEGHKALGDWQAALGINVRCQHLWWYTMQGQTKRDYPAAISPQSPWWSVYPKVEDYFARIHAVMTRGCDVRDLLVLHPVESAWMIYGTDQAADYDAMFIRLRDTLLTAAIDFDYGDEEMLARLGSVTRKAGVPALILNKAAYKAVVIPPTVTMRKTTLALLRKFQAAGGTVVFAGEPARHIDAVPSGEAAAFAAACRRCAPAGRSLVRAVEVDARRIRITDGQGRAIRSALHLLKEDADAFYLFVCNTSHTARELARADVFNEPRVCDRKVAHPDVRITGFGLCRAAPLELDPATGDIFAADASRSEDEWEIRTSLPRLGSRLFAIPKTRSAGLKAPKKTRLKTVRTATLPRGQWDIARSEPNVLVLDRGAWRIGPGKWRDPEDILRIDAKVREALGIAPRGGQMVQPWAQSKPANPRRKQVELVYTFKSQAVPAGELSVALERPDSCRVSLNGRPISTEMDCGWWVDPSLRRLAVDPAAVCPGTNELRLVYDYDQLHSGLEICYLLGDFGVLVEGTAVCMTAAPRQLRLGDWVSQGLPFYSGSVTYLRTVRPALRRGQRLFVEVPSYRGAAVRVWVDGSEAGVIAWEPNEVDITPLVGSGPVELQIEIISHRRNSHGPLHHVEKWPAWTGAGEFVSTGQAWTDTYQLVPCGLMAPPRLIVRRPEDSRGG